MTTFAIGIVHNEQDIVGATVRHLLEQGVDQILVVNHRSTDRTADVLGAIGAEYLGRIEVWLDHDRYFHQKKLTNELVAAARARGADWILPFDADEFWVPTKHRNLVDAVLAADIHGADTIAARVYSHLDRMRRVRDPAPLPKLAIAVRSRVARGFRTGNHATEPEGVVVLEDLVEVREIPYRSEEHFVRKMRERLASMLPDSPEHEHVHYKACDGLSEAQLRVRYRQMQDRPCVLDPIRTQFARFMG
jgi:glycosyltransferase involved in cell wall biosynthesis